MGWTSYNDAHFVYSSLIWVAQALYITCFIPQIVENFRRHSERGLSDYFLIGNLNSYIFLFYDIIFNGYPWPYILTSSIQLISMTILILQKFHYDFSTPKSQSKAKKLFIFYVFNVLGAIACIPLAAAYPRIAGTVSAWLVIILFTFGLVSQTYKIYKAKSVEGMSFLFITLFTMASACEFYLCLKLDLPVPYLIYTAQNIGMFFVFTIQFLLYSRARTFWEKFMH